MQYIREEQKTGDENRLAPQISDISLKAFESLGSIGHSLFQVFNESSFNSELFRAKESISELKELNELLDKFEPSTKSGFIKLLDYLEQKVDRRIKNTNIEREAPIS